MTWAEQDARWRSLVEGELGHVGKVPFARHWQLYQDTFAGRPPTAPPPFVVQPSREAIARANVTALQQARGLASYAALHAWSVHERDAFWSTVVKELSIPFRTPPRATREGSAEDPRWFPGATLTIVDACFARAPRDKVAIVSAREGEPGSRRVTYGELAALVDRVASGFRALGLTPGAAVSLYLPMTVECVAAYLGIIKAGGVVVSIADSFAPLEVATRNRLGNAKAIVTTSAFSRGGKLIDLYQKVRDADSPRAILVGDGEPVRAGDITWSSFLGPDGATDAHVADPYDVTNVLFSSGTTGEPKSIPWTHLTPIKAAMDARYHQDVHADDILAWPTSIGWMMGPWLVYASLVNGATMALFEGTAGSAQFPRFVRESGTTILGVVPALVRSWKSSDLVGGNFEGVRVFSSTGEASNVEDQLWLMSTAGYRAPVIEYCGGTEIGGGHLTGTVVQPQSPATFSTPALGLDFVILDEHGHDIKVGEMGEIFLAPPSVGLSQRLLNRDHHKEYYAGTPRPGLRRHGDEVQKLGGGYYAAHGRADDTMNLGGIKVSSAELERVLDRHPSVYQSAAVAVIPPEGGADQLVVFCVRKADAKAEAEVLKRELQDLLKRELNPLYRIHDVVLVDALPRTASNKIMRRELRKAYVPGSRA